MKPMTRTEERELHKFGRKLIMGTPGVEEAMKRSILDELAEDEEYQDIERQLWQIGDTDRDH